MSHNLEQLKQDVINASHAVDDARNRLHAAEQAYQNAVRLPDAIRFNITESGAGSARDRTVMTDC
ncbi:hypothetical protein [Burkholderia pseudomallei]|uniref:hypothetical protein n=1 Tax=Burkholderia pseudomallei TaxID=28450 RepID=UPI00053210C8|nr:hypothetical protein [Burkholderia pseudomallei]KGR97295.1 hypothetical protein X977_1282 [Burkholderia pseudomallei MSHR7504]